AMPRPSKVPTARPAATPPRRASAGRLIAVPRASTTVKANNGGMIFFLMATLLALPTRGRRFQRGKAGLTPAARQARDRGVGTQPAGSGGEARLARSQPPRPALTHTRR